MIGAKTLPAPRFEVPPRTRQAPIYASGRFAPFRVNRGQVSPHLREWEGLVADRSDDVDALDLVSPGGSEQESWSSPFRGIASDNRAYYVKTLEGRPRQGASLAIEFVVAGAGRLINAPICPSSVIRIPKRFEGWEIRPGVILKEGLAHGSRIIDHSIETRPELAHRSNDDNRARQVGIYALYDWCYGADPQWVYDLNTDRQIYTFDHGEYLPEDEGPKLFTRDMLMLHCDDARVLSDSTAGLSPEACRKYAAALQHVGREQLSGVLNGVPKKWPISNDDLEALGWFLEYRAPFAARRLLDLAATQEGLYHG